MSIRIKILEDRKSSQFRKVDGVSGKLYPFVWDDKIRAYTYRPKNQVELDDIMNRSGSTTFAPIVNWETAPKAPVISDEEKSQLNVLLGVLRMAGIDPEPGDNVRTAQRLLRAYDKGREDEKAQTAEPKSAPVIQPIVPMSEISAPAVIETQTGPVVEVPLSDAIPGARGRGRRR